MNDNDLFADIEEFDFENEDITFAEEQMLAFNNMDSLEVQDEELNFEAIHQEVTHSVEDTNLSDKGHDEGQEFEKSMNNEDNVEFNNSIDLGDGNFEGFDIEEVNTPTQGQVIPSTFSIKSTLEAEQFDDFSILAEDSIKFPYLVFSAKGNLKTVSSLCSGILTKGTTQLYFRPEPENPQKLIPLVEVNTTPLNIRNLLRMALKDSVYYRVNQDAPERLASPEQFIRYIDLGLQEDEQYWNELIESESNPTEHKSEFVVEDLFD